MKTVLKALLLLGFISFGYSLKCFVCNSHEYKDCYSMPEASKSKYLKDCSEVELVTTQAKSNVTYTLCRKLHMFMDQDVGEAHPSEDRVHRACGYVENVEGVKLRGDCYYKSGYNTRTWVCSCKEDECNAAPNTFTPSAALAITAPILALVVTYLRNASAF